MNAAGRYTGTTWSGGCRRCTVTPSWRSVRSGSPGPAAHDSTCTSWPRAVSSRALVQVWLPIPPCAVSGGYSSETRQMRSAASGIERIGVEDVAAPQRLELAAGVVGEAGVAVEQPERGPRH